MKFRYNETSVSNNQRDYLHCSALLVSARSQEFKVDLHVYLT